MIRKLGVVLTVLMLVAGCSQQGGKIEAESVTLAELTANTGEYVGKVVEVSGTVNHVCRVSGKKLFITGDSPGQRFKVDAGAGIGTFDIALEGSDVRVVGLIEEQRVDAAYLNEWETEACSTEKEAAMAEIDSVIENHKRQVFELIMQANKEAVERQVSEARRQALTVIAQAEKEMKS